MLASLILITHVREELAAELWHSNYATYDTCTGTSNGIKYGLMVPVAASLSLLNVTLCATMTRLLR